MSRADPSASSSRTALRQRPTSTPGPGASGRSRRSNGVSGAALNQTRREDHAQVERRSRLLRLLAVVLGVALIACLSALVYRANQNASAADRDAQFLLTTESDAANLVFSQREAGSLALKANAVGRQCHPPRRPGGACPIGPGASRWWARTAPTPQPPTPTHGRAGRLRCGVRQRACRDPARCPARKLVCQSAARRRQSRFPGEATGHRVSAEGRREQGHRPAASGRPTTSDPTCDRVDPVGPPPWPPQSPACWVLNNRRARGCLPTKKLP